MSEMNDNRIPATDRRGRGKEKRSQSPRLCIYMLGTQNGAINHLKRTVWAVTITVNVFPGRGEQCGIRLTKFLL
ncbi:hypothetical protein CUC44_07190 [Aeromonas lusitana]|uniref:Uncharacterized protein n=1 Tax=Aeromonas lusitana TaxID=931529 RepID=A0A2M8HBM0_9GAMM|nr:hypothetical protein CUC44_07190 [Aeromonas lusitana]